MSDGGGQALVGKRGRAPDGGLTKLLPTGGPPPSVPREKSLLLINQKNILYHVVIFW